VRNLLQTRGPAATVCRQRDEVERRVAQRTEDLALARVEALERLARTAEFRDDATGEHPGRVGRTAALLARELRLAPDEVERVALAAPLHDVGMIAVPDAILHKPGRISRAEYVEVQRHVLVGDEILGGSGSPVLRTAAMIARSHHERWDGRGYPAGLRGDATPLAWPLEQAVAEIRDQSAGHFDPDVVAAFCDLDHAALLAPLERPQAPPMRASWGANPTR
jgi:putative two-component system response regulator